MCRRDHDQRINRRSRMHTFDSVVHFSQDGFQVTLTQIILTLACVPKKPVRGYCALELTWQCRSDRDPGIAPR